MILATARQNGQTSRTPWSQARLPSPVGSLRFSPPQPPAFWEAAQQPVENGKARLPLRTLRDMGLCLNESLLDAESDLCHGDLVGNGEVLFR